MIRCCIGWGRRKWGGGECKGKEQAGGGGQPDICKKVLGNFDLNKSTFRAFIANF